VGHTVPVIPKPASTVILMDQQTKVYMTKRPKTMKFLGGFYVFPGGQVDVSDEIIDSSYIHNCPKDIDFSIGHYIAAARELFEEVGILLAESYDGFPAQINHEKAWEYRSKLVQGKISFLDLLREEDLYFNLDSLKYFGHRITPKERPYRYDTRFFIATLPKEQTPLPDPNEIDEAFWIEPHEAIKAFENGEMPMARPTILSLRTIEQNKKGFPLMMPESSW
jgi:8-oxo-dGTP pyrophosphatase MutT (NUDIX family)